MIVVLAGLGWVVTAALAALVLGRAARALAPALEAPEAEGVVVPITAAPSLRGGGDAA